MRVRMVEERVGPDNGVFWPAPPGEIDVPDDLGAAVCKRGWAVLVAVKDAVETREAKPAAVKATATAKGKTG